MKLMFIAFILLFSGPAFAQLNVVATTTDLAALAREVGGETITVKSLARGGDNPHYLEPKPSYATALNRADLLIEVGLDLEAGWLPPLLTQARNAAIQRGASGHLDASEGLALLEIPSGKIDRSQGDVHPMGNPHYWLDPRNGIVIAERIAMRLAELDSKNAERYAANLAAFKARLTPKIAVWEQQAAALRGEKAIAYHKTFSYFAHWLGMDIAAYIEPKPGIPPSPTHILATIELVKRAGIRLLLSENYYDTQAAQKIAADTGAVSLVLPTSVGALPEVTTYEGLFDYLIHHSKAAR